MTLILRNDKYITRHYHNGVQKWVNLDTSDREEAEAREREVIASYALEDSQVATFKQCLEWTKNNRWNTKRDRKQLEQRGNTVAKLIGLNTPVSSVNYTLLAKVKKELAETMQLAPSTINRYLAAASAVLSDAEMCGHIQAKPKIPLSSEKGRERIRVITREEEARILSEFTGDYVDIFVVLIDTGMRVGEVTSIISHDVHTETNSILVRPEVAKSGKPRTIPMTKRVRSVIDHALTRKIPGKEKLPQLFPYHPGTVARWFVSMREALGLQGEVVPHSCRHTCATRLLQAGVDIMVVKEILGHHSITMTQRYLHLTNNKLQSAMSALEG